MEHKELCQLLNSIIRSAKLSSEKSGCVKPFAMKVSDEGRISQLGRGSRAEQTLEDALGLLARYGSCNAVGFCSTAERDDNLSIFVEHRDGTAFSLRLTLNDIFHLQSIHVKPLRAEPKFFVREKRTLLLASAHTRR
jgi:hypothetical protein